MANNPLYPGYIPTDEVSGLYPGYYPGKAAPRRFGGGGGYPKPSEFNMDQMYGIIDDVQGSIEEVGNLPKWTYDRIMDDWSKSFKVNISGGEVSSTDLDDYDPASMPGAFGISIDLNPVKWYQDPLGMAKDTLVDWWKSGVNWQDLETKYRQETWNQVFKGDADTDFTGKPVYPFAGEAGAVSALGENLGATVGLGYSPTDNPLKLYDRKIYDDDPTKSTKYYTANDIELDPVTGTLISAKGRVDEYVEQHDVMKDFAKSISEFEVEGGFGYKREQSFDKAAFTAYRATVSEMEQLPSLASLRADPKLGLAISSGRAGVTLVQNMDAVENSLSGKYGLTTSIKKAILNKNPAEDALKVDALVKIREAIVGAPAVPATLTSAAISAKEGAIDRINKTLHDPTTGLARYGADASKNITILEKFTKPHQQKIESLINDNVLMDIAKRASDPAITAAGKAALQKELDGLNLRNVLMKTEKQVGGGTKRSLIRHLNNDMNSVSVGGVTTVGEVVTKAYGVNNKIGSVPIRGAMGLTRHTQIANSSMDMIQAALSGNLPERYIWPKIRGYFSAYTPATLTQQFLEKNHNFGLSIDAKDAIEGGRFENSIFMRGPKTGAPGKLFGNWFDVKDNVKIGGLGVSIDAKIYGGGHFVGVHLASKKTAYVDIVKKFADADNGWIKTLVDEHTATVGGKKVIGMFNSINFNKDFKELMEVTDDVSFMKFLAKHPNLKLGIDIGEQGDFDAIGKSIGRLKEWFDNNKDRVKSSAAQDSGEYYAAFLTALNNKDGHADFGALGIGRRYAGFMQKLNYKLNQLQSSILASPVGRALARVVFLKQKIIDTISALLSKGLTALASWATGGLLAPFAVAIERMIRVVLNFVLNKAVEITTVATKAIFKADFDSVFKFVDKEADKMTRVALVIMGAIAFLFVGPTNHFMRTIAVSFSPVDNTIGSGVGDQFMISFRGSGELGDPISSVASTASPCFEFVDYGQSVFLDTSRPAGTWPTAFKDLLNKAITALKNNSGGYLNRLCEPGPISLVWIVDDGVDDWCGYVTSDLSFTGNRAIYFGQNKYCWSSRVEKYTDEYYEYLFAHETGHVFDNTFTQETFNNYSMGSARREDRGETLPTYAYNCSTNNTEGDDYGEDYGETVGNMVRINTFDCDGIPSDPDIFCDSSHWKGHCTYMTDVLQRPY